MRCKVLVKYTLYFIIVVLLLSRVSQADQTLPQSHRVYRHMPLDIPVALQQERVLRFPESIQAWVDEGITQQLHVETVDRHLYLTALVPFNSLRLKVRALDASRFYLLDLSTTETGGLTPLVHVIHQEDVAEPLTQDLHTQQPVSRLDWHLRLIRYAAQQLYAPERLKGSNQAISPSPVNTQVVEKHLIRGSEVKATSIARWRSHSQPTYYVTAYRLENLQEQAVNLQHHELLLRGKFIASSFQHLSLAPRSLALQRNDLSHVTTLYVTHVNP